MHVIQFEELIMYALVAASFLKTTLAVIWIAMFAVVWIFVALWPAVMAKSKGYNFVLFFIFSLFYWWIAFFVVLFMPSKVVPAEAKLKTKTKAKAKA